MTPSELCLRKFCALAVQLPHKEKLHSANEASLLCVILFCVILQFYDVTKFMLLLLMMERMRMCMQGLSKTFLV